MHGRIRLTSVVASGLCLALGARASGQDADRLSDDERVVFFPTNAVLVGDPGEQDPETYGAIAREHPGRILHIAIRDVSGEARDDARYAAAFRDLPDTLWVLWTRPDEIRPLVFETAR
ncbi:MAG: phosphatase domain-containing protein [Planctomycetota bacterium]|jgi:phosphatidate phosphatase APP1